MDIASRMTADEARLIAGRSLDDKVDAILDAIRKAAQQKKRKLRAGWDYKDDCDLWITGGYAKTNDWKQVKSTLESLGYKVSFYYREAQFVDMYTLITW